MKFNDMKKILELLGIAILGGIIALSGYKMLFKKEVVVEKTISEPIQTITANYNPALNKANLVSNSVDFTIAAGNTVNAVVHVKNISIRTQSSPADIFLEIEVMEENLNKLVQEVA